MKIGDFKILKVSKKTHLRIKLFSAVQDRKMHEVVDDACRDYLDKSEAEKPKAGNSSSK